MRIDRLMVGPLQTNCWVVSAEDDSPAIVIDPGGDAPVIRRTLGSREIAAVVLTHAHFDHLGAAGELVADSGALLAVHELDADRVTSDAPEGTGGALFGFVDVVAPPADRLLRDGDVVEAPGVRLRVLHTPGHTHGGISLLTEGASPEHLFSGDTLFQGSVGRSDLPGGDGRQLAASIAHKLADLPEDTIVHPGHGPDTTIGREARINMFWPRGER